VEVETPKVHDARLRRFGERRERLVQLARPAEGVGQAHHEIGEFFGVR
jgi:hypothetical protein